jgi:regulatory protein YycI of two-component signal transduction system YycFG
MTSGRKRSLFAILFAISFLLNLIFLAFAFVQKAAADNARIFAEQNHQRAIEVEKVARMERASAEQAQLAENQALKDCLSNLESTQQKKK